MKKFYDHTEVSRLVGISTSQIRYWDRTGLIPCAEREGDLLYFDFRGLVFFRSVKTLLDRGIPLRKIRKAVDRFREMDCGDGQASEGICISVLGDQIVLGKGNRKYTPEGQILIDYESRSVPPVPPVPLPVDLAEDAFFQALEAEQEGDLAAAARRYESVLLRRPDHVDALVNLGNIRYADGHSDEAERYYRKGLRINPDHLEANYNLANIFEDRGDIENALLFYTKALHEDPQFADAHFNIARLLELKGEAGEARKHWLEYLKLEPCSEWADRIRSLIASREDRR
jgi:tetratricopeptide (TPR) repeat protein